jgi:ribosomal protein S27E
MTRERVHSEFDHDKDVTPDRITRGGRIFEAGGLADRLRAKRKATATRCASCGLDDPGFLDHDGPDLKVTCEGCGDEATLADWMKAAAAFESNTRDAGRPEKRCDGRRLYRLAHAVPSLRCPNLDCRQPNTARAETPYESETVECVACGEESDLLEWEVTRN